MENAYFQLLKTWCDRLLALQIRELPDPALNGGILCPVCHRLHGRSADLLPALFLLARETKNADYLDAAKRLFHWSERNLKRSDGGMFNDSNHKWNGITVFAAISIGEALTVWPDLPDAECAGELRNSLLEKADFVAADTFLNPLHNINYPASSPAALEYAYRFSGKASYREIAEARYRFVTENFVGKDGIIFGEGKPFTLRTPRGCGAVDVGYDLAETLPNLAIYADLTGDAEKKKTVAGLFRAMLPFLLPDGAIDNTFGARAEKWTYYGSRTCDGMGAGLVRLADLDPMFGEAAERNFRLMRDCTVDGLLAGGRMYGEANEIPCVHHAITHSKTLAAMAERFVYRKASLPCDRSDGTGAARYPTPGVVRVARGGWIASVSDTDFPLDRGRFPGAGGSMTLLYHRAAGAILTASMMKFALSEPNNMQYPRHLEAVDCTTPRIVAGTRTNAQDRGVLVTWEELPEETRVTAKGRLTDDDGVAGENFTLEYRFRQDEVELLASTDAEGAEFRFFPISDGDKLLCANAHTAKIERNGGTLTVTSPDGTLQTLPTRHFHPAGGFLFFPMSVRVSATLSPILKIQYCPANEKGEQL